jgi:hypothetical protein
VEVSVQFRAVTKVGAEVRTLPMTKPATRLK